MQSAPGCRKLPAARGLGVNAGASCLAGPTGPPLLGCTRVKADMGLAVRRLLAPTGLPAQATNDRECWMTLDGLLG